MARVAVQQALAQKQKKFTRNSTQKHCMVSTLIVEDADPAQVHINLIPKDNGEIAFEVYCESKIDNVERVVHSHGRMNINSTSPSSCLDIQAVRADCSQQILSSEECYESLLRKEALAMGPGHRGIDGLFIGENQVLAKLSLPTSVSATQDQFVLHPACWIQRCRHPSD